MEDNNSNFRNFFKSNIDFLFILDMKGNIIEINDAVRTILGYKDQDIIGQNVLMIHPPDMRNKAQRIVQKMINGEESSCPIPLLTANNEKIPVETRVFIGQWNLEPALIGVSRNLTDLRLSEEKFSNVFNQGHTMMAISTLNSGIFINVNQQFLSTLGYAKDEIVGSSSKELDMFHNYKERDRAFEIFKKTGSVTDYEVIIKTKSGELLNCLLSIDKIKIQTFEYLLTSAINITELKRSEKKITYLYNQQKLLAEITQLLNGTLHLETILDQVLELLGKHTNVSRVYIFEDSENRLTTSNTHEWCNKTIFPQINKLQNIPYEGIPSWKKILMKEGRVFSTNIEELPQDVANFLIPQEIKSILVYPLSVQNSLFGFIGFDECSMSRVWTHEEMELLSTIANIISSAFERKIVLKKLESSELQLKMAISSAKEGIWDWNNSTGHVYFNDTWCAMLGYKPEEILSHVSSWEKLVHPDDLSFVYDTLLKHLRGETEYYETVHRIKTKDGSYKWILDHGMVIERDINNEPLRTIGTHIDVTGQKETEFQLKELINTKDKLFSIIAHDLRGPIGNLFEMLELLTEEEEVDLGLIKRNLFALKDASKSTYDLLENLLNWSRSQTNSIILEPRMFSIVDLIDNCVELLKPVANSKSIKIAIKSDEDYFVFADYETINIVIRNLISNAIKFTKVGGKIDVFLNTADKFTQIIIRDTGLGMTNETIEKILQTNSFYTSFGTNNEKGSGLGLVLCRDYIDKNKGKINIESKIGEGSSIIVYLPNSKASH